jgi:enamine deaminase RidA (YjgF/YER057c/UK114 family)
MKRQLINSGSSFENAIGYSRAVVQGDWVFVSGTTGFNYETMTISETIEEQTVQCFKNIMTALTKADAALSDVIRVLYIVPDAEQFEKCWPILKNYFGDIRPAATMISAGLADSRMKIEIEVTALKQKN